MMVGAAFLLAFTVFSYFHSKSVDRAWLVRGQDALRSARSDLQKFGGFTNVAYMAHLGGALAGLMTWVYLGSKRGEDHDVFIKNYSVGTNRAIWPWIEILN